MGWSCYFQRKIKFTWSLIDDLLHYHQVLKTSVFTKRRHTLRIQFQKNDFSRPAEGWKDTKKNWRELVFLFVFLWWFPTARTPHLSVKPQQGNFLCIFFLSQTFHQFSVTVECVQFQSLEPVVQPFVFLVDWSIRCLFCLLSRCQNLKLSGKKQKCQKSLKPTWNHFGDINFFECIDLDDDNNRRCLELLFDPGPPTSCLLWSG